MDTNDIFSRVMDYSSTPSKTVKPKIKKSERLLMNIEKQGFNMSQLEDVIKTRGNQLIISIAGSGKTTALIFKIIYDIVSGEATRIASPNNNELRVLDRVWVCTFLKSGADELKGRLALWQNRLGVMDTSEYMAFSTLHAEFKRALTAMGVTTNIIDASVNSKNLKAVLEKFAITYEGKPLNSDMLRNLESALTYTRNRLDSKRYDRSVYDDLEIGPTIIDTILREWKQMRIDLGCMDFEDLQELLYEECYVRGNLEVINFLSNRYSYIYVDEFQDTSQIQYALLSAYASGVKKIVVIGDDDQTIYSWRGSDNKIITERFATDFKPTISSLSVNYRCPSTILEAIKPSIEKNQSRFKKEIKSYTSGGILRVGDYSNYKSMVENLADLIYDDIKNDRTVAVLCRVNSDGLLPALMLDKLGKFQYTISGDGMTLDSYMGRQVINIARLFTEKYSPAVRGVLNQLTWNKYSISNIMKVCKNNKVSFWEIPDKDLAYSCPDIANKLIMWKSWRNSMGDIKALKLVYQDFSSNVYSKDTQYNIVFRSVLASVMAMLDFTHSDTVEEFIDELEDINERLKARKKKFNGSKVRIATVHEFKGKEADSVYVWNDSENVYPTSHTEEGDVEEWEEERRIHYIACTRARKISTIMCRTGKRGPFLKEMDLSDAEILSVKIGGELKKKDMESKVDKLLEDEKYISFESDSSDSGLIDFSAKLKSKLGDSNEAQKSSNTIEVSPEDREYIIEQYREGREAFEIQCEMEEAGYDMYGLSQIEDVIEDYKRSIKWGN